MKILTPDKLIPYLPYDLYFMEYLPRALTTIAPVKWSVEKFEFKKQLNPVTLNSFDYEKSKPILRPLSDLTRLIAHNGRTFTPLAQLLVSMPDADFRFRNYNDAVIECWNESNEDTLKFYLPPIMGMNSYQHVQHLISWHFDVFGLIPKGLAINFNTLQI